jgi:hypothetical protein
VPVQRRDRFRHVGSGAAHGEHGRASLGIIMMPALIPTVRTSNDMPSMPYTFSAKGRNIMAPRAPNNLKRWSIFC